MGRMIKRKDLPALLGKSKRTAERAIRGIRAHPGRYGSWAVTRDCVDILAVHDFRQFEKVIDDGMALPRFEPVELEEFANG